MTLSSDDILGCAADLSRHEIEDVIDGMIAELDARDGDPDFEPEYDFSADDFGECDGDTWRLPFGVAA